MNISLELIRLQRIHEQRRLSYRDSALIKAKFIADKQPPQGLTRRIAKKRAVNAFLKSEEEARQRPIPIMDGPSDYTLRGW